MFSAHFAQYWTLGQVVQKYRRFPEQTAQKTADSEILTCGRYVEERLT